MAGENHSEVPYRTLVEHSTEAAYVVRDGDLVYLNPAAVRLFGAPSAEALLGTDVLDRIHPDDHPLALKRRTQVLELNAPVPITEMRFIALDGRLFEVEVQATAIDFGGPATYASARDISARRLLESRVHQAEKLEALGRLAGGVAHDFNNALSIILGHTELALAEVSADAPMRADLAAIQGAAKQSAALTRQLLTYARRQERAPRALDLNEALASALPMLRPLVSERIRLDAVHAVELWTVTLDPSQFDQILASLSANARDAIDGRGTITISTENRTLNEAEAQELPEMAPGEYVMFTVSDDGRGMSSEMIGKVFDPFFTTKGVSEGAGLGLASVYGIVKQNHGAITVKSVPGRGTTFSLFFPRHLGAPEEAVSANRTYAPSNGGETILVAEDEPAVLRLTERALRTRGYQVLAAGTADAALRLATVHPGEIHLLLTDVMMPVMTGPDLARAVSAMRPEIKVLFISGFSADLIARGGVLDAETSFIEKPFSLSEIAAKVRELLDAPERRFTPA